MISVREAEDLDDIDMAFLASAFMIAGVESTASIMQWFSALIPAYPDIQRRAKEELDRVVGRHRLPDVEDEKNLPYCHAIVKEIERCHNPFWLGTPHVASENFIYKGEYLHSTCRSGQLVSQLYCLDYTYLALCLAHENWRPLKQE